MDQALSQAQDTDIMPVLTAKGRQLKPRLLFRSHLQLTKYPTQSVSILKGLCSQSYGFSSSHIWMWELNHKEGWEPKNWHFQTMVLEKTLESPLDCKEIQPVNPKGNQSWIFIGRTDGAAEAPILWPPDWKRPWSWERLKAGGEGDNRGWDGWMVSWIQSTWVWENSGR